MTMHDHPQQSQAADDMIIETIFPTLLIHRKLPEAPVVNARLAARFGKEAEADAHGTPQFTNVGGWHSAKGLQYDEDPDVRRVMKFVTDTVTALTIQTGDIAPDAKVKTQIAAWAYINTAGHYNELHIHRACTWAAVYYVTVPDQCHAEPGKGALELLDPRPAPVLVPTPGAMFRVTCPPRLPHS